VNHTSDSHPWFQESRSDPDGPYGDYYMWSDTDDRYPDARIIFVDTEESNWTFDPVRRQFYWHRFFSHQPDLNYDNPKVQQEMIDVMRFWLDLGIDGFRLDAVPYLFAREGTNCENLPETHAFLKQARKIIDDEFPGRVLLAEANQWPADVVEYFGDPSTGGDECHMAFHFPLMPRIFMALRLEDRLPITEIMAQTPAIPDTCQWGLFLRNHDELTLEMVSEEERDYMYLAYSADPRMRINIGIRRRLAPLMDNNRRRIELLNSLLFSFPGTPILYYGDEIGMGDNIYLGDRNGVRTPMQWSADRNGGFSRATPARLYSPLVMDPVYGYDAINVEAQQSDASSLLHWMRNMIGLRKLFKVFGRGTLEFLHPSNRKVLAYLRSLNGEQVLCVANLSRFAQPVELDLTVLEGLIPVEMLGYVEFRKIGREPYQLTLGPYGFLWFELQPAREEIDVDDEDILRAEKGWESLLEGADRQCLEARVLPRFLAKQRWFGGKARRILTTSVVDWGALDDRSALLLLNVRYVDGSAEMYFLPLAIVPDGLGDVPSAGVLSRVVAPGGAGVLQDGAADDATCAAFLAGIAGQREFPMRHGVVRATPGRRFAELHGSDALSASVGTVEQSNTSIRYGSHLILKLFRRQQAGPNPDCEIGRFLTEQGQFDRLPPFVGAIEYLADGAQPATLAMLQGLIANQGDGWTWTLEELERYYESVVGQPFIADEGFESAGLLALAAQPDSKVACDHLGIYLDAASVLGRRTAEMHLALATVDDPAFVPEPFGCEDLAALVAEWCDHAMSALDRLKENLSQLPDDSVEPAGWALGRRRQLLDRFSAIERSDLRLGARIRIHGDYHLGQVLRVKNDYAVLDFEGEPARSLAERRARHSPLKDVAGMLRSFSYAAGAGLRAYMARRPHDPARLESWARLWERSAAAAFLRAYTASAAGATFLPADAVAFQAMLEAYLLDKALYELMYELDNRPAWIGIPLRGILTLQA
jgi:maltose alpha-D-glucosyltransferase/alpha-amylase